MNFKPTYMIVDGLPDVPDEDDEDDEAEGQGESNDAAPSDESVANSTETAKVPPLQPPVMPTQVTLEVSPSFQQQAGDNATRRDALQHQFDQLQSKLAAACAAHPDECSDLEDLVSEFRLALREFDLAVANEWLQKLTEALDELPEVAAATPPEVVSPQLAQPPTDDSQQAEFTAKIKAVLPIAVPLAKAGGELSKALMPLLKTVQAQRATGDFIGGLATVTLIEQILKESSSDAATVSGTQSQSSDAAAQFEVRLATLLPFIKNASGTPPGDAANSRSPIGSPNSPVVRPVNREIELTADDFEGWCFSLRKRH